MAVIGIIRSVLLIQAGTKYCGIYLAAACATRFAKVRTAVIQSVYTDTRSSRFCVIGSCFNWAWVLVAGVARESQASYCPIFRVCEKIRIDHESGLSNFEIAVCFKGLLEMPVCDQGRRKELFQRSIASSRPQIIGFGLPLRHYSGGLP